MSELLEETGNPTRDYYITLAKIVWAQSTPRQRKRWHKRDSLVYSILKGLGEL